ncbi:MAG: sensor histidine kinase [Cyanobium sp. M30B3]|jgi:signal transduction histidine kinase|nr:MAG: sensor histidine kinase [Cyanobium sp. M30B3]
MAATTLQAVRTCLTAGVPPGRNDDDCARRQWWAALATLQNDLLLPAADSRGIWLAAPLPALYEPQLLDRLQGWVWTPAPIEGLIGPQPPRLPGSDGVVESGSHGGAAFQRLSLLAEDGTDPLLLVITPSVQAGLCLDGPPGGRRLVVRFEPAVLSEALALIHRQLAARDASQARQLRLVLGGLGDLRSDPELGLRFWPRLADRLASMAPSVTLQPVLGRTTSSAQAGAGGELALLEALTHEVRTPLATIRTLIRSLLRRQDLSTLVRQRLEQIDGECSEQIDRFGLIFLAAELQRQAPEQGPLHDGGGGDTRLARTDLSALLGQLAELWQRQLDRRSLQLDLQIPPGLPTVLSDPARLETMLGGLMDRFSRGLPAGSSVRVSLQPAGSRLKLQLSSSAWPDGGARTETERDSRRSIGPVLSWNPSTGSLHLSRQATQQLFRQLGGRLTERNGSALTVFFPIG